MATNFVRPGTGTTADTDRAPSRNLWESCPWASIREGVIDGIAYWYDFNDFRLSTNVNAAEAYWSNGFKLFGSDGAAVASADILGGGITVSSDGDNEGLGFGWANYPLQISRDHRDLWFEARLKTSTITDTKHGFFLGLTDAIALSATVPIAAAGTLADENFVGFHRLEGDGDKLDTVYKADGVTQVTVQADAVTLEADTFIKLGMRFNPNDQQGRWGLSWYYNGLRATTDYNVIAAAGTDFPNDVRLGFAFALLNATATTPGSCTIDWLRVAQVY
jgi:hypothetical protein